MNKTSELEKKGIIEALGVKEDDLFEAKTNLLGFWGALLKIDQRLKKQKQ